jgi:hypothetical protein
LKTNYYGTRDVLAKLLPLVRENGRVVNVSSTAGRLGIVGESLQKKFTDPSLTVVCWCRIYGLEETPKMYK